MAIGSGVVIKLPDRVLLVVGLTVRKFLKELDIAGCVHCFVFGEYLTVPNVPNVYCKSLP